MSISPDEIVLTPQQQQKLARLAEQTGKPWVQLLGEALASIENGESATSDQQQSVYDALVRLGLLGCVKDGPVDLSTNPEYMQGFGRRDG